MAMDPNEQLGLQTVSEPNETFQKQTADHPLLHLVAV
jgi:hypothetical protein